MANKSSFLLALDGLVSLDCWPILGHQQIQLRGADHFYIDTADPISKESLKCSETSSWSCAFQIFRTTWTVEYGIRRLPSFGTESHLIQKTWQSLKESPKKSISPIWVHLTIITINYRLSHDSRWVEILLASPHWPSEHIGQRGQNSASLRKNHISDVTHTILHISLGPGWKNYTIHIHPPALALPGFQQTLKYDMSIHVGHLCSKRTYFKHTEASRPNKRHAKSLQSDSLTAKEVKNSSFEMPDGWANKPCYIPRMCWSSSGTRCQFQHPLILFFMSLNLVDAACVSQSWHVWSSPKRSTNQVAGSWLRRFPLQLKPVPQWALRCFGMGFPRLDG